MVYSLEFCRNEKLLDRYFPMNRENSVSLAILRFALMRKRTRVSEY